MVEKAPKSGLTPLNIMVTVNETAVKRGLSPQPHQFYILGRSIITEATARGLDPQAISLSDGQRLDIWEVDGDMAIQADGQITDFLGITVDDERGRQRFKIGVGTPSNRLGALMITVCKEFLGMDLTPQPLYKGPKERGVKSAD